MVCFHNNGVGLLILILSINCLQVQYGLLTVRRREKRGGERRDGRGRMRGGKGGEWMIRKRGGEEEGRGG